MRPWLQQPRISALRFLKHAPKLPAQRAFSSQRQFEAVLEEWVQKQARPVSLRQLSFFARTLTAQRLLDSANFLRHELPIRIAHRIRDMQTLPYAVVTNAQLKYVYESYCTAFHAFRNIGEIKTLEENDGFCAVIRQALTKHLSTIPRLTIGVLECRDLMEAESIDRFMNATLRSRISRRVLAEQHLALTESFQLQSQESEDEAPEDGSDGNLPSQLLIQCHADQVLSRCAAATRRLAQKLEVPDRRIPEINLHGDLTASFPYVVNQLEYVLGELLRNSMQAVLAHHAQSVQPMPPINVLVCESNANVTFRLSDQGGGVGRDILPYLWSFSRGPRRKTRLRNLEQVPRLAATLQESEMAYLTRGDDAAFPSANPGSLSMLSSRPPNLRLGMGLPMSRVYIEYWAGSLEIQSLEGYGVDAFLQISKLGNKNEQLSTRATMDAI